MLSSSAILNTVRQYLYHGALRPLIVKTGLRQPLSDLYWRLYSDSHLVTVDGTTCGFKITNRYEYLSFKDPLQSEQDTLQKLVENIQPDDVVYDVGAHVGLYSCLAAKRLTETGGDGQVFAFEPHTQNARRLQENLIRNDVFTISHVLEYGLSDTDKKIDFKTDSTQPGRGGSITTGADGTYEIQLRSGDSIVNEGMPKPDIVKIDIEGAEMGALRGLRPVLDECRVLYIEVHPEKLPSYGESKDAVEKFLTDVGFNFDKILERGDEYHLCASRTI